MRSKLNEFIWGRQRIPAGYAIGVKMILVTLAIVTCLLFVRQWYKGELDARLISAIKRQDCSGALSALREGADARAMGEGGADKKLLGFNFLSQLRDIFFHRTHLPNEEALPLFYDYYDLPHKECPELIEELLKRGAKVDSAQSDGATALFCATMQNETRTVKILLEHGANPNCKWGDDTILSLAEYDCAKLLLSHGANPLAQDNEGRTPFFKQTCRGEIDSHLLDLLFQSDPNINQRDASGSTMLIQCIKSSTIQHPIHWLLKNGADVNAPKIGGKDAGYTPLMYCVLAVSQGYSWSEDVARDLLKQGADVLHRSVSEENALDVAKKYKSTRMIALLTTWRKNNVMHKRN